MGCLCGPRLHLAGQHRVSAGMVTAVKSDIEAVLPIHGADGTASDARMMSAHVRCPAVGGSIMYVFVHLQDALGGKKGNAYFIFSR